MVFALPKQNFVLPLFLIYRIIYVRKGPSKSGHKTEKSTHIMGKIVDTRRRKKGTALFI